MAQTAVASAATSTVLLAATTDAPRQRIIIENSDANRLHVLLGSAAATTTTAYSFSLAQYANAIIENYNGEIRGIWAGDGAGHALITTN
jgi:hypothetical protein